MYLRVAVDNYADFASVSLFVASTEINWWQYTIGAKRSMCMTLDSVTNVYNKYHLLQLQITPNVKSKRIERVFQRQNWQNSKVCCQWQSPNFEKWNIYCSFQSNTLFNKFIFLFLNVVNAWVLLFLWPLFFDQINKMKEKNKFDKCIFFKSYNVPRKNETKYVFNVTYKYNDYANLL